MKELARALRRNATDAQKWLWYRLRNRQMAGCKFRRQQVIGPYIADFLCLAPQLVIELDGGQHSQQTEQDAEWTRYLGKLGYRVLRFWNHEVLREPEAVLGAIRIAVLDPLTPTLSRGERESAWSREPVAVTPNPPEEGAESAPRSSR